MGAFHGAEARVRAAMAPPLTPPMTAGTLLDQGALCSLYALLLRRGPDALPCESTHTHLSRCHLPSVMPSSWWAMQRSLSLQAWATAPSYESVEPLQP